MFRIVRIVQIIKLDQLTMFPGRMAKSVILGNHRGTKSLTEMRGLNSNAQTIRFRTSNYLFSDSETSVSFTGAMRF